MSSMGSSDLGNKLGAVGERAFKGSRALGCTWLRTSSHCQPGENTWAPSFSEKPQFTPCPSQNPAEDLAGSSCSVILKNVRVWVHMYVCMCTPHMQGPKEPEEGAGTPGTGVTSGYKLPDLGTENQMRAFVGAASSPDC